MRIAIMSGAYVNSGDFLIERRSKELIETILNSKVDILKRNISYETQLNSLNVYDTIVFAGGPIFQYNIYPERIPFVRDILNFKVPIRVLGGGWKGHDVTENTLYKKYVYTKDMLSFIDVISKQYPLGCRDWYTIRNLQKSGFMNLVMTGCPAWYDINKIYKIKLKDKYNNITIRDNVLIGISDPAFPSNKKYFYMLIKVIKRNYPNVKIRLFFHRGIDKEDLLQVKELCKRTQDITFVDMSKSYEYFEEYNECFIHIGFRVHAHIYNLSQGNVSILFNEDARGIGVNHALGLEDINCLLDSSKLLCRKLEEETLATIIKNYIEYIEQSGYMQYKRALWGIRENFKVMESFVSNML